MKCIKVKKQFPYWTRIDGELTEIMVDAVVLIDENDEEYLSSDEIERIERELSKKEV